MRYSYQIPPRLFENLDEFIIMTHIALFGQLDPRQIKLKL